MSNAAEAAHAMKTSLDYLVDAKRCEIAELKRLAQTSGLVDGIGGLVHALQRERGLSNLYLASGGSRSLEALVAQHRLTDQLVQVSAQTFEGLDVEAHPAAHGARLFARVALAAQGLSVLDALRQRVLACAENTVRASAAYARLIDALLAVVFEAADSAADPAISRLLVALFNFSQGKELAGQERATGSALFAAGQAQAEAQQRLIRLIDSQERCFLVFAEFSGESLRARWRDLQTVEGVATLERLRRVLLSTPPAQPLDVEASQSWFDACTQRLDAMRGIEVELTSELQARCRERLRAANDDLRGLQTRLARGEASLGADAFEFFADAVGGSVPPVQASAGAVGPQLERSVHELVHAQAQQLQAMSAELEAVRASLQERKLIERAKGVLMAHRQLSEEDAHSTLRRLAMNQGKCLVEVAEALLAMAPMLPTKPR